MLRLALPALAAASLSSCAASTTTESPRPAPVVAVAGTPVPRVELDRRTRAFADHESFSPVAAVRAYVARLVIDERWAVRDAAELGLPVPEREIDAALGRVRDEWAPRPWRELLEHFGATEARLRERVRGELAARAVADHVLRTTATDEAYGRAFLGRHARRMAATRCRAPYAPEDRCPGGRGEHGERWRPMGVATLVRYRRAQPDELQIALAWLLGIDREAPEQALAVAKGRLRHALPPALARRVRLQHDAYTVYVNGSAADLVAVARTAHRLVLGRPLPVLR